MVAPSTCRSCKLKEKYHFWSVFPSINQKFYKLMLTDFHNKLILPKKFTDCFRAGDMGVQQCTLQGPSGNQWPVQIKKKGRLVLFTKGWARFVRDHGINEADFLMFTYLGNACFDVAIFDGSGCERETAYFALSVDHDGLPNSECRSSMHDREHSHDFVQEDLGANNGDADADDEDEKEERELEDKQSSEEVFGRPYSDDEEVCEEGAEDDEETDSNEGFTSSSDYEREETEVDRESPRARYRGRRPSGSSGAKEKKTKHVSSQRPVVTAQEKQQSLELADSYIKSHEMTGEPMFSVTMRSSQVKRVFAVTIPRSWALEYLTWDDHDIELRVPGEENNWVVGCKWLGQTCQIQSNWSKFVLDNNLKEHDNCVFELIEMGETRGNVKSCLMVHIFHAAA